MKYAVYVIISLCHSGCGSKYVDIADDQTVACAGYMGHRQYWLMWSGEPLCPIDWGFASGLVCEDYTVISNLFSIDETDLVCFLKCPGINPIEQCKMYCEIGERYLLACEPTITAIDSEIFL